MQQFPPAQSPEFVQMELGSLATALTQMTRLNAVVQLALIETGI